jgi:hypothetical protein
LAFCYRSRWISSFPPPRPVTAGSYIGRMGMNSTHTCNRLNTLSFPLYDYPAKITNRACLQFSQDHFGDPINLDSDSSVDYPQTIKKRRVKPGTDLQKYATINVTNDFLASPSRHGHNVRHVATSGKPQDTAMEEHVIGHCTKIVPKFKALYQNFEANEGFNNVPIAFLGCARNSFFVSFLFQGRHPRAPSSAIKEIRTALSEHA